VSCCQQTAHADGRMVLGLGTHRTARLLRLPNVLGMDPLSWLLLRALRANGRVNQVVNEPLTRQRCFAWATHAQILQAAQTAQRARNGPAQLVDGKEPEGRKRGDASCQRIADARCLGCART
jgi:hypothetical protein